MELANFLLESDSTSRFQLGLDMLIRMKKYEEVFMVFINKNRLYEALMFLKRYKINLEYLSDGSVTTFKKLIAHNKSLMIDFINS
jgi:hypothetical protein